MASALVSGVASPTPGTCRERLWLLPSGPDQVHRAAMRGDPPRGGIIPKNGTFRAQAAAPCARHQMRQPLFSITISIKLLRRAAHLIDKNRRCLLRCAACVFPCPAPPVRPSSAASSAVLPGWRCWSSACNCWLSALGRFRRQSARPWRPCSRRIFATLLSALTRAQMKTRRPHRRRTPTGIDRSAALPRRTSWRPRRMRCLFLPLSRRHSSCPRSMPGCNRANQIRSMRPRARRPHFPADSIPAVRRDRNTPFALAFARRACLTYLPDVPA